jgi:hypothetical protein
VHTLPHACASTGPTRCASPPLQRARRELDVWKDVHHVVADVVRFEDALVHAPAVLHRQDQLEAAPLLDDLGEVGLQSPHQRDLLVRRHLVHGVHHAINGGGQVLQQAGKL